MSRPAPRSSHESLTRPVLSRTNSNTIATTLPGIGIGRRVAIRCPAFRMSHSPAIWTTVRIATALILMASSSPLRLLRR